MSIVRIFTPLKAMNKKAVLFITLGSAAVILLAWFTSPSPLLPKPGEVASSLHELWQEGLGDQLITSYILNLQAIAVATGISLLVSYLSVVPILNPLVRISTALRFLSMAGLSLAFAVAIRNPHYVKVAMLAFSISVWFILGMLDVINLIPKEQIDLARTLRMGPWRVVWEVVILGTADKVFDILRQTSAMGWMMLTLVESMVAGEGGVGVLLQSMTKHVRLSEVMAIQLCIMMMGFGQDLFIGFAKYEICDYARSN